MAWEMAPEHPVLGWPATTDEEKREAAADASVLLTLRRRALGGENPIRYRPAKINFNPVRATISELTALPAPAVLPPDHRIAPVELTTYVLRARLIEFKREHDDDFHLVSPSPTIPTRL